MILNGHNVVRASMCLSQSAQILLGKGLARNDDRLSPTATFQDAIIENKSGRRSQISLALGLYGDVSRHLTFWWGEDVEICEVHDAAGV